MPLRSEGWQMSDDPRIGVADWIDELPSPPTSCYNPFADNEEDAILGKAEDGPPEYVAAAAVATVQSPKKLSGSWALNAPRIAAQNALARSKSRFSVHKSTRDRTVQKQPRQTKDGTRPRIFVNTNFSRRQVRPVAGRQVAVARTDDSQGIADRPQDSNGPEQPTSTVDSSQHAQISRVPSTKEAEASPEGISTEGGPIPSSKTPSPYSITEGRTVAKQTLKDGLSPYDRAILIGISMAVTEPSDNRPPVPPLDSLHRGGRSDGKLVKDEPSTPAIVITPAKDPLNLSPSAAFKTSKTRARAASSVYSRRASDPFDPTPIPTPAKSALMRSSTTKSGPSWRTSDLRPKRDSTTTQFEEDHTPQHRNPHASTYTVFEEDDSPSSWEESPMTTAQGSTRKELIRPQSKGWWNYITTPFFTRSSTTASAMWDREQDRPPMPDLAQAAATTQVQEKRNQDPAETHLSPMSPAFAQRKGHETLWTDFSRWEEDRNASKASRAKKSSQTGMANQWPPPDSQRSGPSQPQAGIGHSGRSRAAPSPPQEQAFPSIQKSENQENQHNRSSIRKVPPPGASASGYDVLSPHDRVVPMLLHNTSTLKPPPGGSQSSGLASVMRNANNPRELHMNRSDSNFTEIFGDASPTVHHANVASVVRAGVPVTTTVQTSRDRPTAEDREGMRPDTVGSHPPPYSPPRARLQPERMGRGLPLSGSTNSSQVGDRTQRQTNRFFQGRQSKYLNPRRSPHRPNVLPVTLRDLNGPTEAMRKTEAKRQRGEKEDAIARKFGSLWRGRACFGKRGCFGKAGVEARKRRRWCAGLITGVMILIILILALVIALPRRRKHAEPQPSRWVNITGWPPIPTGVSTIIQPDLVHANTGCVFPSTMWSCALPKEIQKPNSASDPDQPSFRFEIRYLPNMTADTNAAFPQPPGIEDQRFMANTTDNVVSVLKEGEESPFSMTFSPTSTTVLSKQVIRLTERRHRKRESVPFPDIAATIPRPDVNEDGTPKAANLLPVSLSQTLRLYDRGLGTEHYGFYIYFDRSIFLKSTSLLNESDIDRGPVPADLNGGSTEREARVRCTWAQTRFLVQIWTLKDEQTLLRNETSSAAPTGTAGESIRPGSFPYPVTITTDRHGGDVTKKMIYCYGLDARARVVTEQAKIQIENRGFGGKLVGGGQGPLRKDRVTLAQGGMGGIDGGTGGCACRWKNFIDDKV
ncbi:MAG: hypothetical protein M1816_001149 [Peltula sp. TS41687]|nr:MAG: hypothetical protein M1816_001149 [Peltula sp. TS41687]